MEERLLVSMADFRLLYDPTLPATQDSESRNEALRKAEQSYFHLLELYG